MSLEEEIGELHRKAWSKNGDFVGCLNQALSLCEASFEKHSKDPVFMNNYAAVLLDLHRDEEALDMLKKHEPTFFEHCSNYAIAIAKTSHNIDEIRKWNHAASTMPRQKGAIEAYIDWQAM